MDSNQPLSAMGDKIARSIICPLSLSSWENLILLPVIEFPWTLSHLSRPHKYTYEEQHYLILFFTSWVLVLLPCTFLEEVLLLKNLTAIHLPAEWTRAMRQGVSFYSGILGTEFWKHKVTRGTKIRKIISFIVMEQDPMEPSKERTLLPPHVLCLPLTCRKTLAKE